MINRLRRNNIRFKGKSITPIFFDFGKLPLSVIGDFSKFYELVLFVLKKANLNKELETYIEKMLLVLINSKNFYYDSIKEYSNEEHIKIVKNGLGKIHEDVVLSNNYFKEEEMIASNEDIADSITYQIVENGYISASIPDKLYDDKKFDLFAIVEESENIYKSLLSELINIAGSSLTLSKDKVEYNIPIIRERVGDDIGIALNELTYALVYLINSYSFRNDSLAFFDIIEIDKRYDYSMNIMEHFLKRLEA